MNLTLNDIVAATVAVMEEHGNYVSTEANALDNTLTKVRDLLLKKRVKLDSVYYDVAEEILAFYRSYELQPEYHKINAGKYGSLYSNCAKVARKTGGYDDISIVLATAMPYYYGKVRAKRLKSKASKKGPESTQNTFLGVRNKRGSYFVKLVNVGPLKKGMGFTFELIDQTGNVAFFYETIENLEGKVKIGDCFLMYATVMSHVTDEEGVRQTIFRNIEIVDNSGAVNIPTSFVDSTGGIFTPKISLIDS